MHDARARYVSDSVATAGPARLLTMLYDRLLLDLERGATALGQGDRPGAMPFVGHAQDVVCELIVTLDETVWDGADRLMSIYTYVLSRLVHAGATGDADALVACHELLEPLALAWHEAADDLGRQTLPAQRGDEVPSGLLGVG
jgi:flagellar secretion chaperone FliS